MMEEVKKALDILFHEIQTSEGAESFEILRKFVEQYEKNN